MALPTWKELVEDIDSALGDLDELPDTAAAIDFGAGVEESLRGIRETVVKRHAVTPRQRDAVANMADGISRWLHR